MKKLLVVALSVAGLVFSTNVAFADDEKTVKGEGQCAKCSLKKGEKCQNVIVAKEEGKEVVYYLTGKTSDDFHSKLCRGKKDVKAKGTVKKSEGKVELAISSIELIEAK